MIIKSKSFEEHVKDLEEIFFMLDQYQIKLNSTKYAFFIQRGKFFGIYGKFIRYIAQPKKGSINL